MKPTLKEIKPISFFYFRASETRVDQLLNFVPVAKELFREAANCDLHVTGPIHWHYFGFSGDASRLFTLEISLPVSDVIAEYDGNFHFKRTDSFRCVTLTHEGGWNSLPASYSKIIQFIEDEQLEPSQVMREIYLNTDFKDPNANVTVIQMGVK
jgi:effector-binding domain-containing protein